MSCQDVHQHNDANLGMSSESGSAVVVLDGGSPQKSPAASPIRQKQKQQQQQQHHQRHFELQKDSFVMLKDGHMTEVIVDQKTLHRNIDTVDDSSPPSAADTVCGVDGDHAATSSTPPGKSIDDVDPPPYPPPYPEHPIGLAIDRCHSAWIGHIESIQVRVHTFLELHHLVIARVFEIALVIAYFIYLGFAACSPYDANVILWFSAFVVAVLLVRVFTRHCGQRVDTVICGRIRYCTHSRAFLYFKWVIYILLLTGVILFLILDVCADLDVKRMTSFGGMLLFLFLGFATSKNPSKVKWRPVLWGLGLQFLLGLLILRWRPGFTFFKFLGDQVRVFLEYADEGSKFVFGETEYEHHRMAFKVFPIVIYFSAVISIFYYWGLMQFVVCKIAWLMQFTMGTTAIESLNAACNIFIGMAESTVIMRPFLYKLTKSELHAVMTGGFATVAGSYIALLIEVGASPEHLLSAAIMSAPAALAMAKLSYPETEISHTKTEDDVYMENTPARNLVEAASNGAIAAVKVVSSVAANLIAILGLIAFLNAILSYMGNTVGNPDLSFKMVCSYIFWPLAVIMGVEVKDAGHVAGLIGTKIFADEFISFKDLGEQARRGVLNERSTVIATYACCGFGSIAAVGVYIGALISVAPDRRGDISEVALRAVINGNVACFLTACIAGVLYTGQHQSLMDFGRPDSALSLLNTTGPTMLEAF